MTSKLKNTKLLKIIREETQKALQEQVRELDPGQDEQETEDLLAQVEKRAAESGLTGQPLKALKHLMLHRGLDYETALERAKKVAKMHGTEEKNPDYDPALSKLMQAQRGGMSIAEMLFKLSKGELPNDKLGDVFELKSILRNNQATRSKNGRLLIFAMESVLNDMIAQAKVKKDPNATYTIVTNGKAQKKKYASKVFKDEMRPKMREALAAMVVSVSIDPSDPRYKEIKQKTTNEGNIFTKFWIWIRDTIDDILEYLVAPLSASINILETVIRSPGTAYRIITGQREKCMAAGIVFPSYKPAGVGIPVGHAAFLVILPQGEQKEGEEPESYKIQMYDFGRYSTGGGTMTIRKRDVNNARKYRKDVGTVRQTELKGFGKLEWGPTGQLTSETQNNIMIAFRKNSRYRKYAKNSSTMVAWLKDIDPFKAEEEAKRFKVRPYGLFYRGEDKFGYTVNGRPKKFDLKDEDGNVVKDKKGRTKKTTSTIMQVENCATFVLLCLNKAAKSGASIGAKIRAQLLATPRSLINMLANEFDEEVTTYGTDSGEKTLKFRQDMQRDDGIFDLDVSGEDWEEIGKKAAGRGVVKPGSAITWRARKRGATNQKVYAALQRAMPAKVFENPYFKGWNVGNPGKRTKRLIAMYQISKGVPDKDVDGRLGKDTWDLFRNE